ncbi:MAG: copper amine oxidase N-terminal domain-containing protein [Vulcanimicrobiaceae bacterium]
MKRLSTVVLAGLFAAGLGLNAVAAPSGGSHGSIGTNVIAQDQGSTSAPPANFGSPPSGQIPILYNDHHVYAKPDVLKQGRVLAALVRGDTVLIPLRSMFEQMGATVSYDSSSKTVDVTKPGADVKVTVGKPEVVINGESRPLDVPPIMYQGNVLVPIRVISEGMGAYVLWVADKQLVVVRYIPPTPPPTPAPPPPTPPPTPSPTPMATPYKDLFIAGDFIISPKVYNEFSPGNVGTNNQGFSFGIHGAWEFNLANLPWMLEGDFRQFDYPHNQGVNTPANWVPGSTCLALGIGGGDQGCVTAIGGRFSTFVPAFTVRDYDFDARFGIKVLNPRIYVGVGYLWRSNNYGYPHLNNIGFGAEKLPDLDQPFGVFGSIWYYPNVNGKYTDVFGNQYNLAYNILKYSLGVTYAFQNTPLFLEGGWLGDNGQGRVNAPASFTHNGPFVGIGLKF